MDCSGLDESALAERHDIIHFRTKPACHSFCDDLRNHVDETDGSELSDGLRGRLFLVTTRCLRC
jgi:hypothetical protein